MSAVWGLAYGGGNFGLKGAIADAVLERGGEVIGVIPEDWLKRRSSIKSVDSIHERKALMAQISDGFIALPGGFGTSDEFYEILIWAQFGPAPKAVWDS